MLTTIVGCYWEHFDTSASATTPIAAVSAAAVPVTAAPPAAGVSQSDVTSTLTPIAAVPVPVTAGPPAAGVSQSNVTSTLPVAPPAVTTNTVVPLTTTDVASSLPSMPSYTASASTGYTPTYPRTHHQIASNRQASYQNYPGSQTLTSPLQTDTSSSPMQTSSPVAASIINPVAASVPIQTSVTQPSSPDDLPNSLFPSSLPTQALMPTQTPEVQDATTASLSKFKGLYASDFASYAPLFSELEQAQIRLSDDAARFKMLSDRIQAVAHRSSYPMPLTEPAGSSF